MITEEVTTDVKDYLSNLKINGEKIFSSEELTFLLNQSSCKIFDFTQELGSESEIDFYHHFAEWLQENPQQGYIYYYVIAGMKKGEHLSDDEFNYLEGKITDHFDTGYGWIAQTNKERRFKRRLKLILFIKHCSFRRLIPTKYF